MYSKTCPCTTLHNINSNNKCNKNKCVLKKAHFNCDIANNELDR